MGVVERDLSRDLSLLSRAIESLNESSMNWAYMSVHNGSRPLDKPEEQVQVMHVFTGVALLESIAKCNARLYVESKHQYLRPLWIVLLHVLAAQFASCRSPKARPIVLFFKSSECANTTAFF